MFDGWSNQAISLRIPGLPKTFPGEGLQQLDFSVLASSARAFPKPLVSGMPDFRFRIADGPGVNYQEINDCPLPLSTQSFLR